ncbi:MAG: acetylglutamate kinase [Anaerolineae bacterium]|nr:acetylglutamate kinase [Anaerolineae bacterium]
MTNVLKIGGNQLDDPIFIAGTAQAVAKMTDTPVIVHGGGKGIKALQEKLGIQPQYIDGLRVTDAATLEIVMMVLCGQANLTLVSALIQAGVDAQGFNGADRGVIRGQQKVHPGGDLGRVGEVASVRVEVIREALAKRVVPVIAPVLLGADGGFYNANADRAAGAVAAAIGAEQVIFLTDVPGVLHDGKPIEHVTQAHIKELIASGVIKGGMAVKVGAALDALSAGVPRAVITNLEGLARGTGTVVAI